MDRRHGSRRPDTVSVEENMDLIKEFVCSQEEWPHTHLAPRKIAEQTRIGRSSIWRIVKNRNLKQFKPVETPKMSEGTRNRRETRAVSLRERFDGNIRMIQKMVWQDEKDFTLEVPVSLQNDNEMVKERNQIPMMKLYLV